MRMVMMMLYGKSWSGNERNCIFLNPGRSSERFADISATSGLDFVDDARAVAPVDWDFDGDLDLWLVNRTAPQIRWMRNNAPSGNHFIAFRLQGTTCNRDAIGARLELYVKQDGQEQQQIQTLHAGEGFLSQRTKWVHFGLGCANDIERLVVRWPGGQAEEFRGLKANERYTIVQDTGVATAWHPPERGQLSAGAETADSVVMPKSPNGLLLRERLPTPPLRYTTQDDNEDLVTIEAGKPVLLNLWASWCHPCVAELREFTEREAEFRKAGLEVIAISVDGLGDDNSSPEKARQLLDQLQFPFKSGQTDGELVKKLQLLHDYVLHDYRALPIPTSVLLDANGDLAAIYKGPISVDHVLADTRKLRLSGEALQNASQRFPGRWHTKLDPITLVPLVDEVITKGFLDDAILLTSRLDQRLTAEPDYPVTLHRIGVQLGQRGEMREAAEFFRNALRLAPNSALTHAGLGAALLEQGQIPEAISALQESVRLDPNFASAHVTLGIASEKQGDVDQAVVHYVKAVELDSQLTEAYRRLLALYEQRRQEKQAIDLLRKVVENKIPLLRASTLR